MVGLLKAFTLLGQPLEKMISHLDRVILEHHFQKMDIQIRKGAFQADQKMSDNMSKDIDFFLLPRILCMESVTVKLNSNPEKGMLQKIFQLPGT